MAAATGTVSPAGDDVLVELGAVGPSGPASLEFQEFGSAASPPSASPRDGALETASFLHEQGAAASASAEAGGASEGRAAGAAEPSVCSLAFYQRFFNVTTQTIKQRLFRALVPRLEPFFSSDEQPDLYGPFWVTMTLVLAMAVLGNLSNFVAYVRTSSSSSKVEWRSDIAKLSIAAAVLFSLITVMPTLLWCLLRQLDQPRTMLHLVALYGYSLVVFLPVSVICVLPFSDVHWFFVALGTALSLFFLFRNLFDVRGGLAHKRGLCIAAICLILLAHLAVAAVMRLYFFNF